MIEYLHVTSDVLAQISTRQLRLPPSSSFPNIIWAKLHDCTEYRATSKEELHK